MTGHSVLLTTHPPLAVGIPLATSRSPIGTQRHFLYAPSAIYWFTFLLTSATGHDDGDDDDELLSFLSSFPFTFPAHLYNDSNN